MPHGPIDTLMTGTRSTTASWYWDYGVTPIGPWNRASTMISEVQHLKMPATVVNLKRPDGTYPVSGFSIRRARISLPPFTVHQTPKGSEYYTNGGTANYSNEFLGLEESGVTAVVYDRGLPPPAMVGNTDAKARIKFLSKLADASGKDKVKLGAALGEVRETIHMATELATGLLQGVRSVSRSIERSPQLVSRVLRSVSTLGVKETAHRFLKGDTRLLERIVQGWLVYQFGIRPLAMDVSDAVVWIERNVLTGPQRLYAIVRAGATDEEYTLVPACRELVENATFSGYFKVQHTVGIHYSCVYEIPTTATLPEQFGLYNMPAVGWEVCRFSWLVDYAVDVGGWLRSMMAAQNTHFVEGTMSKILRCRLVDFVSNDDTYSVGLGVVPLKGAVLDLDAFDREVLNSGVMPPFFPALKNTLGIKQLANALAALAVTAGARSSRGPWQLQQ